MNEVQRIRVMLRGLYRGPAWHGPAIRELLTGVDAETAAAHPIPNSHSIWELILHMTYWRTVAAAAVAGGPVDEQPPQELDWPPTGEVSDAAWQGARDGLEATQKALLAGLAEVDDSRLSENVTGRDYSVYFMLHGLLQHDIYHAGQIALLKKTAGAATS